MNVACLAIGSKVAHDGDVWTVVALTGAHATLEDRRAGRTQAVAITSLLSSPDSRLLGVLAAPPIPAAPAPRWPNDDRHPELVSGSISPPAQPREGGC